MEKIEEKVQLDEKITKATKDLKDLNSTLELSRKEKIATDALIATNKDLIEKQNILLKGVINDISTQKLEWMQQKAREEAELKLKHEKVDEIIAREGKLNKKELEIQEDVETAKVARNETRQNLLLINQENEVIESKKKEIQKIKDETEAIGIKNSQKIQEFKDGVARVIETLSKI